MCKKRQSKSGNSAHLLIRIRTTHLTVCLWCWKVRPIYLNTFVLITPCIMIFADINECSYNRGGCEQLCINSPGHYTCSCLTGYTLQSDGKSCQGMVDEVSYEWPSVKPVC